MKTEGLPFCVSTLIFIKNEKGEFLLLKRNKSPNKGFCSPVGGKVDTARGESPHLCGVREVKEETGFEIRESDLHLFAMVSEKGYEGERNWLLFLFECKKAIDFFPRDMAEGVFGFYSREEVDDLVLPITDREGLWPLYDRYRNGFVALRADCDPSKKFEISIEEVMDSPQNGRSI